MSNHQTMAAVTLAVASLFASPAHAQEATSDTWMSLSRSVASRAEVRDELRAAQAGGAMSHGEAADHDFTRGLRSMLTREQVAAEAAEACRLGLTAGGEVLRFPTAKDIESIRRAGVRAIERRAAKVADHTPTN
jgi:hypothetical protein